LTAKAIKPINDDDHVQSEKLQSGDLITRCNNFTHQSCAKHIKWKEIASVSEK
jgi:hypothetical protein